MGSGTPMPVLPRFSKQHGHASTPAHATHFSAIDAALLNESPHANHSPPHRQPPPRPRQQTLRHRHHPPLPPPPSPPPHPPLRPPLRRHHGQLRRRPIPPDALFRH